MISLCCRHTPQSSISTLAPQQAERVPLTNRVFTLYHRIVSALVEWIKAHINQGAAAIIGTFLLEPGSILRAVFDWVVYGFRETPHFSGVNPQDLTDDQLQMPPVLCLHGNYHCPAAFTEIAKALRESYNPAIFTIKLPSGRITDRDRDLVREKIQEIKNAYESKGAALSKIDLIGHSRGGYIAWEFQTDGIEIRTVLIGFHPHWGFDDSLYEINGVYDCFLRREEIENAVSCSQGDPEHRVVIDTGHLGLLYSPTTCEKITEWLQPI
jgi:hypothetical protein